MISFFLPFSESVCLSNRENRSEPSQEWLYGRIEGQEFINQFALNVQKLFDGKGIRCGVCIRKCPAHAISLEFGRNNARCRAFLLKTRDKYAPRYGCGKCQVGVPCEFRAPGLRRKEQG